MIRGARRHKLLESYGIEVVLDVGANVGQYGTELRCIGYKGRIVSFEPLSIVYYQLEECAKADAAWETLNFALGDTAEGYTTINIAGNSQSSSLLKMLPSHIMSAPQSAYVGTERIEIRTLDSLRTLLAIEGQSILLKIDTQGSEKNVIAGEEKSIHFIDTLALEMSLTPMYEGELPFNEMYELLCEKGYRAVSIDPAFTDERTGEVLQVDVIFHRF